MDSPETKTQGSLGRLSQLGRLYRHMGRVSEMATILVKFGFDDFLLRVGLTDLLNQVRGLVGLKVETNLSRPERIRLALEELGVVFIKWGQYLSTRDDFVPKDYIYEFSRLQNTVAPVPYEMLEKLFSSLLATGEFSKISAEPLAAASIAQVHEATLSDGAEVVVKVRRPGLRKQVVTDLEILADLAELVEKHLPALASTKPGEMVAEFTRGLLNELDFTLEAINIERFGRFYATNSRVKIPRLYRSLCSQRVLVMEKMTGHRFNEHDELIKEGYNPKELARFGAEIVLEQIMIFGFFHGDPHPGNLLVQPGPRLVLLDFGLVGRLNKRTRQILWSLTLGVVRRSPRAVTTALLKLLISPPDLDRERLEMEIEQFMEANLDRTLKELNIEKVLRDMLNITTQYELSLPPDIMLLIKALSQVEGLGLQLDPNFDIVEVAKPLVLKEYKRRSSPRHILNRLREYLGEAKDFFDVLPNELKPLLKLIKGGHLKCDFQMEGMEELRHSVDKASYRMSFALVLASLVIGSSIVIHADIPPKWHDLPVLGLVGFVGAALVGFWLLYDFLKNRRF